MIGRIPDYQIVVDTGMIPSSNHDNCFAFIAVNSVPGNLGTVLVHADYMQGLIVLEEVVTDVDI